MSSFPAIPLDQKTEKNVKLFLDGLAGRMGIEGRAVTFQDLFDSGMIQLKEGINLNNIQPGTNPIDIIDVPTGALPDTPTTPTQLGATSSWGAIFLDWDYKAYNDEYGTEIHRSPVNDRSTATLIAVATGTSYKDIVGALEISYFYWVRNRSGSNTVGGFNQLNGVLGNSNLRTTVEDFILHNPDIDLDAKPFSIADFNNDPANPDYKIFLNADVLIKGDLAIGQLITGEMPEGVEFSIGQGSIVMSTDTGSGAALGSILVTGNGGISGNDFLRITSGAINSEVWDENSGQHVPYKQLKRVERGQTQHGVPTKIPAYFKFEPTIYITPRTIVTYNPAFSAAEQKLVIDAGPVTPSVPFDGSWWFTPDATLYASSAIKTEAEPYDVSLVNIDTDTYTSLFSFTGAQGVSVTCTVASRKLLADGTWQNRQVTIYIDGELNGVGGYNQIGTTVVSLKGDGTTVQTTINIPVLTVGTWKFRYRFVAADRAGTTDSAVTLWEYEDDTSNSGNLLSILTEANDPTKTGEIVNYRPVRGAEWKLFAIDYKFTFNWKAEAWCVRVSGGTFPDVESGFGEVLVPSITSKMEQRASCSFSEDFANCGEYPYTNDTLTIGFQNGVIGGTGGKIGITEDDPLYLSGKFTTTLISALGDNNPAECIAGQFKGTARVSVDITGFDVTYYYRKPIAQDLDTHNDFKVNSLTADLGAVSITAEKTLINWLAAGE